MDALEILQVVLRRWWAVLPVLALTGGAAWYLGGQQPQEYSREMAVLVLGPAELETEEEVRSNPYRGVGLDTTAQALVLVGESGPARQAAQAAGVGGFDLASTRNSPIVRIESTGTSPEQVVSTLSFVAGYLDTELQRRQDEAGAPPQNRITLAVLDPPEGPVAVSSGALRIRIAVAAAGLLLAVLLAVAVDRLIRARRGVEVPFGLRDEPVARLGPGAVPRRTVTTGVASAARPSVSASRATVSGYAYPSGGAGDLGSAAVGAPVVSTVERGDTGLVEAVGNGRVNGAPAGRGPSATTNGRGRPTPPRDAAPPEGPALR